MADPVAVNSVKALSSIDGFLTILTEGIPLSTVNTSDAVVDRVAVIGAYFVKA
jgi:hypothetical protein